MNETGTWAQRVVERGDLYLRRRPGARWEINFYERSSPTGNPFVGGMFLRSARLDDRHFRGRTFGTPDEAAEAVRQFLAR